MTSGGGLSYNHPGALGVLLLVEAVRQLRGEAGRAAGAGRGIAVAHGVGGLSRPRQRWCWAVSEQEYGDPLHRPFWQAAREHRLIVQYCRSCAGRFQFYARPFCLECQSDDLEWVPSAGMGTVYTVTTVRIPVLPEAPPPYQVAIVELDEGVRMLAGIEGTDVAIGDRVEARWREQGDLPPLPVFAAVGSET